MLNDVLSEYPPYNEVGFEEEILLMSVRANIITQMGLMK